MFKYCCGILLLVRFPLVLLVVLFIGTIQWQAPHIAPNKHTESISRLYIVFNRPATNTSLNI